MSLWNRAKVASVLMAIAVLISALADGFLSFDTSSYWFNHPVWVFVLFGALCLVAPLVSKWVSVEETVGSVLFGGILVGSGLLIVVVAEVWGLWRN